ncbi:sideroflexin-4 isoform 2-T3 [Molossus nigricans]
MEPNVHFWITQRQSFIQRFLQWTELLDPTNLVISIEKIEKSRQLLLTNEDGSIHDLEDHRESKKNEQKISFDVRAFWGTGEEVWEGCPLLASLQPLTDPVLFASSPAFHGTHGIFVAGVSEKPKVHDFTSAVFLHLQHCVQRHQWERKSGESQEAQRAATFINRHPYESILLGAGVIASTTFFGLFSRLILMKYPLKNILLRETLPVIILANISAVNVVASRSFEPMRGVEVMDKHGNVIGYSRRAGTKAVKETATSRVVLFGTSALIPEVFSHFFKKTKFFMRYPQSLWTLKLSCTFLAMGLMAPVSFSMFPQIERIQCSKLEQEIQSATEETELFYNRGV